MCNSMFTAVLLKIIKIWKQPFTHWWTVWKLKSLSCVSLWPRFLQDPNSQSQNTGVSSLSLLQGLFPSQGLNSGLLHCRQFRYQLSHLGSPRILEWVACPFSSRSFQPRNQTGVSYTAGRIFTNWAVREENNNTLDEEGIESKQSL